MVVGEAEVPGERADAAHAHVRDLALHRCERRQMLEDLIAAAFNDAVNKANAASQDRMSAATAGMPMPPGMKLPF